MCCGYELTTVSPKKQEYKSVKDKPLKATLQYIFEDGFPHSVEEVCLWSGNKILIVLSLQYWVELKDDSMIASTRQSLYKNLIIFIHYMQISQKECFEDQLQQIELPKVII